MRELLEAARDGLTGALVVSGEAGIGKTTLLGAAGELADGFACLWARGVESEAALGHAALLELLTPVRHRLADLPAAQAAALTAALGWGPPRPEGRATGDRYLVAAATLSLLAAAAESGPVLVVVDDLHWADRESAAALLEARIAADGGVGSMGEPLGVAPDLVEAYVGLGRAADAAALAGRYADVTASSPAPPTVALVARCRGLTAVGDDAAAEAFETALAAHAQVPDAFETARTRLLYGARLRRAGRRVAAREQLRVALDAFVAMDLTVWARRAADELGATGATARPRRPLASEPLTSQETRVALLVARGLSNREVAAALFLSPKTIEHHLASVFRKRGFRSRAELAAAFATEQRVDEA